MFNFFSSPPKSLDQLKEEMNTLFPTWTWSTSIKDANGKEVPVTELIEKYNRLCESVEHLRGEAEKFYEENKKLKDQLNSIEEDGTEEHNAAIKLRQENAQLKVDIESWMKSILVWRSQYDQEVAKNTKLEDKVKELENEAKTWVTDSKQWRWLYNEKADAVDELMKEVNGLRHLKKENVDLIERNRELLEKYNGTVAMGGLKYMEAKLQVVQNNYKKCAEERDEFKFQLKAANKEIEALKKEYEVRLKELHNDIVDVNNENKALKKEKAILERWKYEQLIVNEMWNKVDSYVRDHVDAPLGGFVSNTCLNFLKERDELKANAEKLNLQITALHKIIEGGKKTIDDQKEEIKKLKEDIVDYVIEKDDKLKEAEETIDALKGMKTQGFEDYDPTDFVEQKHPMYPIHWGGYKEIEFSSEELLKRVTEYVDYSSVSALPKSFPNEFQNEKTTAENLEDKFDEGKDVLDYFEPWQCPCSMCKHAREENTEKTWEQAASDLALKVAKLEKQIEELKIINVCQKPL